MLCPRCGNAYNDEYTACTTCGASRVAPTPVPVAAPAAVAAAPIATSPPTPAPMPAPAPPPPPMSVSAAEAVRSSFPSRAPTRAITFDAGQAARSARPDTVRPGPTTSPAFARDTTRYLCAAVSTHSALNSAVIRALIDDKHQALAFSPGVDTATVLRYALAARVQRRAVDVLLAAEVVIFLVFTAQDGFAMLFWGSLAAWLTVHLDMWDVRQRILRPKLRRSVYNRKEAPEPENPRLRARIEAISGLNADENVTVGTPERPFPGFGQVDMERSSAVDLTDELPGRTAQSFTVHDLYTRAEDAMRALDLPGVHVASRVLLDGRDLPHLAANGFEALLPNPAGPPATCADERLIRTLRDDPVDRARAYLAVRVTGWSGEVVVTYFVRFHRLESGDLLFVELSRTALAPLREEFQRFDRDEGVFRLLRASLSRTPRDALGALPRLAGAGARWAFLPVRHWLEADAISREDFAYRPRSSVRELAAMPATTTPTAALPTTILPARIVQGVRARRHHRRLQDVDREMYDTLIERKLAVALADFLAEHGIASGRLTV